MPTDYRRQAIQGSVPVLVASVIVFALGYAGFEPSTTLFAVFATAAVVFLGGWYVFDRPWYLTGIWVVPATVAAVMVLSGDASSGELEATAAMLAALGVVTVVIWPTTAYFAQKGESVGNRLTDDE